LAESCRWAPAAWQDALCARAAAARTADGLIFLPPFPPAAERCALTAELSIRPAQAAHQPEPVRETDRLTRPSRPSARIHYRIIECLPRVIFRGRIDPTGT